MKNEETPKESRCSQLTSIDWLDSRAEQERGAEDFNDKARLITDQNRNIKSPRRRRECFIKAIAGAMREAIEAEREACARIAYAYPRESFNPVTDKLSPTWHIGELIRRRS